MRRSTLLQAHATQLGLWHASLQPWGRLPWAGLDAWAPTARTRASTRVLAWYVRSTTAGGAGTVNERWHSGYTSGTPARRTTPWYKSTVPAPKDPARSKMGGAEQPTRHYDERVGRTRTYNAIIDPITLPRRGPRAVGRAHGDQKARARQPKPARRPLLWPARLRANRCSTSATTRSESILSRQPCKSTLVTPSHEWGQ